ncbi:MAG: DUF2303 family protein [Chloroflexota bacterium]
MGTPYITPVTPSDEEQTQPRLTIDPNFRAADGSEYAFNGTGYTKIVEPWAVEAHIPPINCTEKFGDVESWVNYTVLYGKTGSEHLTWSERGLRAILDYHGTEGEPNRCQWIAVHPFELTTQWKAWRTLCSGAPIDQRKLVEAFEDLGEDISDPPAADLLVLLRTLRGSVNATAATELNADGSTAIDFKSSTTINAGKDQKAKLPPTITIRVPVLKGHAEEQEGKAVPVVYSLPVRIRASVGEGAKLVFRLSMPTAERVLEAVYADRVASAKQLLGEAYTLLRAAS